MILAVDAGNSAVTLGCVEGRDILNLARLETAPGWSADEYAALMERVPALRGAEAARKPEGAAHRFRCPAADRRSCARP
ncbi:MAG: type III pantothenate kinase [Lachnospiraceae bacterium]